jgi:hypothetical protein
MWKGASALVATGYVVPGLWLIWLMVDPPPRTRTEFGGFVMLGYVYWLAWLSLGACAAGVGLALRAQTREAIVLRTRHRLVLGAGALAMLGSSLFISCMNS